MVRSAAALAAARLEPWAANASGAASAALILRDACRRKCDDKLLQDEGGAGGGTAIVQFPAIGPWSAIRSSSAFFTSTLGSITPAFCSARPAARIESRCGAPMRL